MLAHPQFIRDFLSSLLLLRSGPQRPAVGCRRMLSPSSCTRWTFSLPSPLLLQFLSDNPSSPCPSLSTFKQPGCCKAAFIRAVFTKGSIPSMLRHSILISKNPCVMCSCIPEVAAEAMQIKVQLPEIAPKRCLLTHPLCQNKSHSIIR